MIEPKRYKKQNITRKIFSNFFEECGDYNQYYLTIEASPIWTDCYDNHDYDVFECLENKDVDKLKELYENYYINGLSDGATSGKALENENTRKSKSDRNLQRTYPLAIHLKMIKEEENLDGKDFYNKLYQKYNVPKTINIGQTWGWDIGDNFVHFEIQDYIYFLDIIQKILKSYVLI